MDLAHWIERQAAFAPARCAIRFAGQDISYAMLAARIDAVARALAAAGVATGDRVAFLGLNNPEMLAMLFACARVGAMIVPLNWRLAPPEHREMLADCPVFRQLDKGQIDSHDAENIFNEIPLHRT